MSLVSSSCLELRAPPRLRVGCPAPGLQARWAGWLVFDRLPPRVCSAEQKECRPQGSVTPAQSPGEQLEEADCQALDPSPAHTPPAPAACIPESPTPGSSGQCAPLCPGVSPCVRACPLVRVCPLVPRSTPLSLGVPLCPRACPLVSECFPLSGCAPLCPGVSPCPGVHPCVWACPLVSGCAPLVQVFPLVSECFPLHPGVPPCVWVFPLVSGCFPLSGRAPLCLGVPLCVRVCPACPGVSPCPGVPPCVQVFPLVRVCPLVSGCFPLSGRAPLCPGVPSCVWVFPLVRVCPLVSRHAPLHLGVPPCVQVCPACPGVSPCPGVPPCIRVFPLVRCAPLTWCLFAFSAEGAGPHPSQQPPEHVGPCANSWLLATPSRGWIWPPRSAENPSSCLPLEQLRAYGEDSGVCRGLLVGSFPGGCSGSPRKGTRSKWPACGMAWSEPRGRHPDQGVDPPPA